MDKPFLIGNPIMAEVVDQTRPIVDITDAEQWSNIQADDLSIAE